MPIVNGDAIVGGLGGSSGYGEIEVPRGDDTSYRIDASSAFPNSFSWFGQSLTFDDLYINLNGTVSFGTSLPSYPKPGNANPARNFIAPFWSDVDTRLDGEAPESGSIYADVDADLGIVTVTWDRVGVYRRNAEERNTFQVQLINQGDGDLDILYRYARLDWEQGTAADDAGFRIGVGSTSEGWLALHSLPDTEDLPVTTGNSGESGVWMFEIRDGVVVNQAPEDLVVEGSNASDTLAGGAGNDVLDGGGGNDVLQAGIGADTLYGGEGNDQLNGGGGNDVLDAGSGQNTIDGGAGLDTLVLGFAFEDALVEQSEAGVWITHEGAEFLVTNVEVFEFSDTSISVDDLFAGSRGVHRVGTVANESLTGSILDDTLEGMDGVDTLNGMGGDDFLIGGTSENDRRDVIYAGAGNDSIAGGYGNDELRGDAGNDTLSGGFGADTVIGGAGNDFLTGSAYSDMLFGGAGNDFVNGGFGYDRVNGGAGADQFFHIGIFNHGSDWIQDFTSSEGDVLMFGNTDAVASDFQINWANTANAGAGHISEAFIIYRPTGQVMWALVDGGAQQNITLVIGADYYDLLA